MGAVMFTRQFFRQFSEAQVGTLGQFTAAYHGDSFVAVSMGPYCDVPSARIVLAGGEEYLVGRESPLIFPRPVSEAIRIRPYRGIARDIALYGAASQVIGTEPLPVSLAPIGGIFSNAAAPFLDLLFWHCIPPQFPTRGPTHMVQRSVAATTVEGPVVDLLQAFVVDARKRVLLGFQYPVAANNFYVYGRQDLWSATTREDVCYVGQWKLLATVPVVAGVCDYLQLDMANNGLSGIQLIGVLADTAQNGTIANGANVSCDAWDD
jgi:hypothetical protein